MFLFVALICFSSAIIVSLVAHSHSHSHSHSHTHLGGQGLDLGVGEDSGLGRGRGGLDREGGDDDDHHPHCRYEAIGDETSSPRTVTTP